MIEHVGNCHGEWTLLLSLLGGLPFLGVWLRSRFRNRHNHKQ